MQKSSWLRLITVIGIVVCIILVGYRQVAKVQKTRITQESHLPTSQHLILFYTYLYQEEIQPSLYFLDIDTGKISRWNIIEDFVPRSIRLISWTDMKQELFVTGSLQGAELNNKLYAVKSDGTYEKVTQASLPMEWTPDDKRLMLFNPPSVMLRGTASPNGKWFAFSWCPEQSCAIYRTDMNGKNLLKLTDGFAPSLTNVQWSPDDTKIAFVESHGAFPFMLWVMNSDGTNAMPIVETQGDFAWSPDSSKIAFTSQKDGYEYTFIAAGGKQWGREFTAYTHSIYIIDLITREVQRVTYLKQLETQILWAR